MSKIGPPATWLPETHREQRFGMLREEFAELTPTKIAHGLKRLASGIAAGQLPASRTPYRHINGFTKVLLAEFPKSKARLTLHYWPAAGDELHISRPHNHRFGFCSVLLTGRQRFIELEQESTQAAIPRWHLYEYQPYFSGRFARLRLRRSVSLTPFRTIERAPLKGVYATPADVVHQALTLRDSPCATLVLRGPRERRTANVFYRDSDEMPRAGIQLGGRVALRELHLPLSRLAQEISNTQ